MKKLKELRTKLDEVSAKKLTNYIGLSVDNKGKLKKSGAAGSLEKSLKKSADAFRSGDKEARQAATKTANKRAKGLQMARAKLDKKVGAGSRAKVPATEAVMDEAIGPRARNAAGRRNFRGAAREAGANEAAKYPHMMYDPKTGKEVTAKTPADHNKYAKMGYTHEKPTNEAVQYKVDVEGLPPTFMTGKSPAEILSKLRKIVKQPSMIKSVERHTDMEVRKAYRNKAQGREMDEAGTPERLAMIRKAGEKINKEKKKAERDAKRAIAKDKDLMGEAVTYHGNPNKDDDARNAARRRRLAKQDKKPKPQTEASVVPSKDGKKLVPMKKHSEPKSEPVPNDQFGLPKLQKEAVYGSQAQRMMSPLQKARQDKEKADRDRHGKLHMMKGRPKKLGEISQDLKQRYTDKAKSDYGHQQFSADIAREMGHKDAEKYYRRKQRNRMAGITKAKK